MSSREKRRQQKRSSLWSRVRRVLGRYAYPVKWYLRWARARGQAMGRRSMIQEFLSDVICNAVENSVFVGQLTRREADNIYLEFGKKGLTDLLPKKREYTKTDQRALKGAILNRIGPEARAAFKEKQRAAKKGRSRKAIMSRFKRQVKRLQVAA